MPTTLIPWGNRLLLLRDLDRNLVNIGLGYALLMKARARADHRARA